MSRFGLNIPIQFWVTAGKFGTCYFSAPSGVTRFLSWAAIIVAAGSELFALQSLGAFRSALMFAALIAPFTALVFLPQIRRYRLLKIAVANMWQGVALYNADGRLLLYNAQFCAMLGLSPEDAQRASTHRDIVDLSVKAGNYGGLPAEQVWREDSAFIARRQPALTYIDLPSKQTIAESHEPTADGGWIRTYADVTGRRQVEARIIHMARHDALTDLPNRVLFHEELEHALKSASERAPVALMFLDLDRFKAVNDTLGHAVGDRLLGLVAGRLQRAVGESDTVARLGGDEFAIIQTGIADAGQADELARRLVAVIGDPYDIDGVPVSVGASLGVTFAPADGVEPERLLRNADVALYRAKSVGRSAYCFFAADARAAPGGAESPQPTYA